jgi:hypothetical protein
LKFDLGPDVEIPAGVDDVGTDWVSGSQVEVVRKHEILRHPYRVAESGDIFNVQDTHSTGGIVTTADLILSFYGNSAAPNNFYLTVHEWEEGRVVVNQFGHSAYVDNMPSAQETQLFVNSLYWAAGCGDHFGRHGHGKREKDDERKCGDHDRDRDHDGDDRDHDDHK